MDLGAVVLAGGRVARLTEAHIAPTYGGMLEGYPSARLNDMIVAGLGQRAARVLPSAPVHVIDPPRAQQAADDRDRLPFGPIESLPPVILMGRFESEPVGGLDPVLHRSQLVMVWLQNDATLPNYEAPSGPFDAVEWERWAEDFEI